MVSGVQIIPFHSPLIPTPPSMPLGKRQVRYDTIAYRKTGKDTGKV